VNLFNCALRNAVSYLSNRQIKPPVCIICVGKRQSNLQRVFCDKLSFPLKKSRQYVVPLSDFQTIQVGTYDFGFRTHSFTIMCVITVHAAAKRVDFEIFGGIFLCNHSEFQSAKFRQCAKYVHVIELSSFS